MTELKQYRISAGGGAELVREVEAAVARGELSPGQRLPSVRRLAQLLGLSPGTVAGALAELRRRGVVVSEPRRGTRIGDAPPIDHGSAPLPVPPGARDLSSGNPDPAMLPDIARALRLRELPARMYGAPAAVPELQALATAQLLADGVPARGVCVVSGALDGIERVLQANLRPGDRVAVENPGYAALLQLLRALGLQLEPVAVDDRGMLVAELARALERGARAAIVTPRGQNPTGAALDAQRAAQLRQLFAQAPGTLVVEDDHLGPVAGAPLHTTLDGSGRWAATRSVAKALGPDLRVAVLAGDEHTLARVQGRQRCGPGWVSHILQTLVHTLWTDEAIARQIALASETYTRRRERLLEALKRRRVRAHGASGLNVWIPVPEEAAAVGALMQRGWVVAPGEPYRLAGSPPAIRVTTATLAEREAELLAAAVAELLAPAAYTRAG